MQDQYGNDSTTQESRSPIPHIHIQHNCFMINSTLYVHNCIFKGTFVRLLHDVNQDQTPNSLFPFPLKVCSI